MRQLYTHTPPNGERNLDTFPKDANSTLLGLWLDLRIKLTKQITEKANRFLCVHGSPHKNWRPKEAARPKYLIY
jgi:hypothetical protein